MIIIDLGRLGKAKLYRPTRLEVVALVALLAFATIVIIAR